MNGRWLYHLESGATWAELTEKLYERDREGWEVVNFVTKGDGFVAFLRRAKDGAALSA